MSTARSITALFGRLAAPALVLLAVASLPARAAHHAGDGSTASPVAVSRTASVADSVCRESPRAWHRASGDTLWLYYLADRATARIDTQGVVFFVGDSAIQLRPRPRRIGPKQAERLWDKHQACAAELKRPPRR